MPSARLPKIDPALTNTPNTTAGVGRWMRERGWQPFDFQRRTWQAILAGRSGLVHAPTGIGKTYAVWLGALQAWLKAHTGSAARGPAAPEALRLLWITPLRALAGDTRKALARPLADLDLPWSVGLRTGDTPSHVRARQKKQLPTALITTPESLALLLSYGHTQGLLRQLDMVVADEWHELLGSKRGVLLELGLARLRRWRPRLKTWGLSATLGNIDEAMAALLGRAAQAGVLIKAEGKKPLKIDSIIPEQMERFPWSGHLGLKLLPQVIDCIQTAASVLVFTNTRSQTEIWFQALLDARPDWSGKLALHHGSLDRATRTEVEDRLRQGRLRGVVCTSSLDLGVDFTPVDLVIQIGSPKGIARLLQRAGRSGHQPGQTSRLVFVPTHAFELVEIAAVRRALTAEAIEPRPAVRLALDVLAQHLVTVALGQGFRADQMLAEVRSTHAFGHLSAEAYRWVLDFITRGGAALEAYPEYCRVRLAGGRHVVDQPAIARRHRMSIGTITSDAAISVKYRNGRRLGTVEESFAAKLRRGERFIFAGKLLECIRIKDMALLVRPARGAKGAIPLWLGGRMPLSTELAQAVRQLLHEAATPSENSPELEAVRPLMTLQAQWSAIPAADELLIEQLQSRDGHHLFVYPFEGHQVHEGLAALLAYRLSRTGPMTLSLAVNDYGLELLSDQPIPLQPLLDQTLFDPHNLLADILQSTNASQLAQRKFRDIARIAGLVFQGYPGSPKNTWQLQASSGLIYKVLKRYDPDNLLLRQADQEVLERQLEHRRLALCLERIGRNRQRLTKPPHPTPLAFPIMVNRLRTRISSEKLADRINKWQARLEKAASRKKRRYGR